MRSMLIFNQFENGEVSHVSFFSKDLKLQIVLSCYFRKYGNVSEIGCGRNSPPLCILLYSMSSNLITVRDVTVVDARVLLLL